MGGQTRIVNLFHPGLSGQKCGDSQRCFVMLPDPQRQGAQPAQQQPGIERAQDRSHQEVRTPHPFNQRLRAGHHPRRQIVMPAQIFGGAVNYQINAELERAPRELSFEPRSALTAGPGGLEILTRIVAEAPAHLRPGGWLLCEVGEQQGEAVADLLRQSEYGDVALRNDLAGIARVVGGTRPSA